MNYQGKSIVGDGSGGPDILAAIVVLQGELAAVEEEVKSAETAIDILQSHAAAIYRQLVATEDDVQKINATITNLSGDVSTLEAIGADWVSVELTCPVSAETATLTVPTTASERYFYYFGYAPNNSPFTLSTYAGGNFRVGTYGLIWTRPSTSQNTGAVFEIDALATFFPNQLAATYVYLRVQVRGNVFAAPLYDLQFNDRPFPHSSLQTWSMKRTITVPLKKVQEFAETVTFDIMSSDGGYVYGVGGVYGMQHQFNVKRIQ